MNGPPILAARSAPLLLRVRPDVARSEHTPKGERDACSRSPSISSSQK
jgi:hypothetical protein